MREFVVMALYTVLMLALAAIVMVPEDTVLVLLMVLCFGTALLILFIEILIQILILVMGTMVSLVVIFALLGTAGALTAGVGLVQAMDFDPVPSMVQVMTVTGRQ